MNAYELAKAQQAYSPPTLEEIIKQQADRIAELEKVLGPIKCVVKDCQNHKHQGSFNGDLCSPCYEFIKTGKGIYSQAYRNAQTKPLTDEEIKEIWYDLYPLSSSSYWDDKREGLAELKFARAILRKAQEK